MNTQKPVKKVWDLSGYIGDKQRSGSLDHFSDSSSTTSGAESSSLSSGRIIKNEEVSMVVLIAKNCMINGILPQF